MARCTVVAHGCKPSSVATRCAAAVISLESPLPTTSGAPRKARECLAAAVQARDPLHPRTTGTPELPTQELLAFARGGVCRAPSVTGTGGALLPHLFTLAARRSGVGGLFSAALSRARNLGRWVLPTTVSCRARTFLSSDRDH